MWLISRIYCLYFCFYTCKSAADKYVEKAHHLLMIFHPYIFCSAFLLSIVLSRVRKREALCLCYVWDDLGLGIFKSCWLLWFKTDIFTIFNIMLLKRLRWKFNDWLINYCIILQILNQSFITHSVSSDYCMLCFLIYRSKFNSINSISFSLKFNVNKYILCI